MPSPVGAADGRVAGAYDLRQERATDASRQLGDVVARLEEAKLEDVARLLAGPATDVLA